MRRHDSDHSKHDDYWAKRTTNHHEAREDDFDRNKHRQAFKHSRTSLGVAGHIVHMAGIFIPVLAGELIESPQHYKKVVRLASVGTAMAYEGLHIYNEIKRREKQEAKIAEYHNRLEQCER